jgi:hypothetical protein
MHAVVLERGGGLTLTEMMALTLDVRRVARRLPKNDPDRRGYEILAELVYHYRNAGIERPAVPTDFIAMSTPLKRLKTSHSEEGMPDIEDDAWGNDDSSDTEPVLRNVIIRREVD